MQQSGFLRKPSTASGAGMQVWAGNNRQVMGMTQQGIGLNNWSVLPASNNRLMGNQNSLMNSQMVGMLSRMNANSNMNVQAGMQRSGLLSMAGPVNFSESNRHFTGPPEMQSGRQVSLVGMAGNSRLGFDGVGNQGAAGYAKGDLRQTLRNRNQQQQIKPLLGDISLTRNKFSGVKRPQDVKKSSPLKQTVRSASPPAKRFQSSSQDLSAAGGSEKGKFRCQVCRLSFQAMQEFDQHMNSSQHAMNMKVMSAVYKDKTDQLLYSSHDKDITKLGGCVVCEQPYGNMSEAQHRQSKEHRRRDFLVRKGCLLCQADGFKTYSDYVAHIDSQSHKQKKIMLESRDRKDSSRPTDKKASFSELNSRKTEITKVTEMKPVVADKSAGDGNVPTHFEEAAHGELLHDGEDKKQNLTDMAYDPDTAVGVDEVIAVTGYFCKLCHKFYNNETMARVTHCKSQAHFDKYYESLQKKVQLEAVYTTVKSSAADEVTTTNPEPVGTTSTNAAAAKSVRGRQTAVRARPMRGQRRH